MITAAQIRAARAMTGLSLQQLADAASLTTAEVEATEAEAGNGQTIAALRTALEGHGVQFLADGSQDGGGAGVRLKQSHGDEGTRPENLNATNDD